MVSHPSSTAVLGTALPCLDGAFGADTSGAVAGTGGTGCTVIGRCGSNVVNPSTDCIAAAATTAVTATTTHVAAVNAATIAATHDTDHDNQDQEVHTHDKCNENLCAVQTELVHKRNVDGGTSICWCWIASRLHWAGTVELVVVAIGAGTWSSGGGRSDSSSGTQSKMGTVVVYNRGIKDLTVTASIIWLRRNDSTLVVDLGWVEGGGYC